MENLDLNVLLASKIAKLEKIIGRTFTKKNYSIVIRVILTDASANQSNIYKLNEAYHLYKFNGLETYGDAVLDLFVCKKLFKENKNKEQITIGKSELVSNDRLNTIGKKLLEDIIIDMNPTPFDNISYAKALERLIGAIHEVCGSRFTQKFLKDKGII